MLDIDAPIHAQFADSENELSLSRVVKEKNIDEEHGKMDYVSEYVS